MSFAPSPLTANFNTQVEVNPRVNVDIEVKDSFNIFCCCRRKRKSSTSAVDRRVSNVAKEMQFTNAEPDH